MGLGQEHVGVILRGTAYVYVGAVKGSGSFLLALTAAPGAGHAAPGA